MRNRRHLTGALVTALVVSAAALSACGKAAETGLEKIVEQQGGANVDIDTGNGGISIQTEDGSMTIDENGNFVVTDENGETVTGNADADGESFNVESEDGSFSSGMTSELPDDWPSEVPTPDGLSITSATSMDSADGSAIQLSGTTDDAASFVADYAAQLTSAGFTTEAAASYDGEENWAAVFESSSYTVVLNVLAFEGADPTVGLGVFSSPAG
jgi:hypothetical protein